MNVFWRLHNAPKIAVTVPIFKSYGKRCSNQPIMRILNVAEKNDAAKNIAGHLSGGNVFKREGFSKYNKIYEFSYNFNGQNSKMIMTSVSGHLLNYAFIGSYKKWTQCSPESLFDAPVVKQCPQDYQLIKDTLEREVKNANTLIIWTDCDREGENIGFEIISVCQNIKPNISVYRAKFSEITKQSVKRAMQTLDQPNKRISDAVDVRSELDLRIGASFTRFQTLRLQRVFPEVLKDCLISYGSCQFPTLGFVVERYKAVQNFIPEKFWKIKVSHTIEKLTVEFNWKRVRLFDQLFCQVLFDKCEEIGVARVESVETKQKSKWRPVPLDTVELEKTASRKLKINAKETMRIAERLYSQGFISYPRTETNIFPREMNLPNLVGIHTNDNRWGQFAARVLDDGPNPRQGKKSDQAHPPIHPTKYTDKLSGNEGKVYEYIVRHFLACLSKDAEGMETIVNIDINNEKFVAHGIIILELNYLEVYPYEKWNAKEIHSYRQGQTFTPTSIEMVDGETSAPNLLTEADLISLMEKHGIGTDATHAEHIETIKERKYVGLQDNIYFVPGELGIGLVEGYDNMGFEMSKPYLRAELEADLKKICEGTKDPKIVLSSQVKKYKDVFKKAVEQANKLDEALNRYLQTEAQTVENNFDSLVQPLPDFVMKCSSCGSGMSLRHRPNNSSFISCSGFPHCRKSIWLPSKVVEVNLAEDTCVQCGPDVRLLTFKFRPGSMAPYFPNIYTGCIGGCDEQFLMMLEIRDSNRSEGSSINSIDSNASFPSNRNTNGITSRQNFNTSRTTANRQNFNNQRNNFPSSSFNSESGYSSGFTQSSFNRTQTNPNDEDVQCNCGVPAKKLTVMKESVNRGRLFYVCSKPQGDNTKCNFFMWADGDQQPQASNQNFNGNTNPSRGPGVMHLSRNNNSRNSGFRARKRTVNSRTTTGTRKCGNCRQEGHNRNNCPQLLD